MLLVSRLTSLNPPLDNPATSRSANQSGGAGLSHDHRRRKSSRPRVRAARHSVRDVWPPGPPHRGVSERRSYRSHGLAEATMRHRALRRIKPAGPARFRAALSARPPAGSHASPASGDDSKEIGLMGEEEHGIGEEGPSVRIRGSATVQFVRTEGPFGVTAPTTCARVAGVPDVRGQALVSIAARGGCRHGQR